MRWQHSVDETDKIEQFMVARESFTQKLWPVIWKHRAVSILKKSEDEAWLKRFLTMTIRVKVEMSENRK
jgi:hypothetical protein